MDTQPMNQVPQSGTGAPIPPAGIQTPPMGTPVSPKPKKEGSMGATIAIIVILLLIAAGGYYYFTNIAPLPVGDDAAATESEMMTDESVAGLESQGTSDNLADIEADLNATDLSGLDEASAGVESEFQTQ